MEWCASVGGIAAWIDWTCADRTDEVSAMTGAITHRGPDGSGVSSFRHVTLGHRRLAILDLSNHGSKPMQRGNVVVVLNGEIYNLVELRQELAKLGLSFVSSGDAEILFSRV